MVNKNIDTVSKIIDENDKKQNNEVDLDQALDVAGLGWYNIKYCLALSLFLIAAIMEPVGYSFLLPSAKCDLEITDSARGFIGSVPYIGIVLTSFPWGYLVDTRGRKKMIVYSSFAAGVFGILASFMPDLISFTIFKFLCALCIACPAAAPYSFIGELLPQRYRDVTLSIVNAMQITGAAMVPLLAWAILPLDFRVNFGLYVFRPWRLLGMLYSSSFLISAFIMSFGPESPKFLVSQGRHDESLETLKKIYSGNTSKPAEYYPVKRLKLPVQTEMEKPSFVQSLVQQTLPLIKPPYLKWMMLSGFLLFGLFATLNGLYMWLPDVLNRVLSGGSVGLTACDIIGQRLNETISANAECNDKITSITFMINTIANFSCAFIALAISSTVKFIGKKALMLLVYVTIGVFCVLINAVTQEILFAILLSSLPLTGLAIGPVNAYAGEIYPTKLRGMAIGLSMMVGRVGSIVGTNVAGLMINSVCEATFYLFGGGLIFCGALSLLLPRSKDKDSEKTKMEFTHL
ncbi:synaptic vesicle glycoprotein 2B isoform X2 [Bicyclus anynana]|uniref:Synaptic vesicle glycoprotein 2B isoform X2 n=1 Tax=Bicyclus anynana TaxID=110368 RepID=A0A6J1MZT0_BICAN|nr:synaptic vesicle glycoprotein 2B isoform X2 [Bicyclus anynana]